MKKLIAILITVMLLFGIASAEETLKTDVTYKTLYYSIMEAVKEDAGSAENRLVIKNITIWRINDSLAGFSFQGDDWMIYGEADMATGIVTNVLCELPYTNAGVMMTYMVCFALSEETTTSAFIENYKGENSILSGKAFPNYKNVVDAGNEHTIVYGFKRDGEASLNNEANACDMRTLIEKVQTFSASGDVNE